MSVGLNWNSSAPRALMSVCVELIGKAVNLYVRFADFCRAMVTLNRLLVGFLESSGVPAFSVCTCACRPNRWY